MKKTLLRYLHRPQIRQHTDEWHRVRKGLITATKVSGYLESSPYGPKIDYDTSTTSGQQNITRNQSNQNKKQSNQGNQTKKQSKNGNPALAFGTLHEDAARRALQKRFKTRIYDLGLGIHKKHTWLGASPDGIALLSDGSVTLIEIKCPYYRKITHRIPFDYWVQMQIQMEVWDIDQCIYSENIFTKPESGPNQASDTTVCGELLQWWDVRVQRDRAWFARILPILQRNKQSLTDSKKLFWTKAVDMYKVRNWIMEDPLLDWLDRWHDLDRENYTQDPPKRYNLSSLASKQTRIFNREILSELIASRGRKFVADITQEWFQRFAPSSVNWDELISRPAIYKSFGKHKLTMQAINEGYPVIAGGILLDEKAGRWGKADLLVREDVMETLFTREGEGDQGGQGKGDHGRGEGGQTLTMDLKVGEKKPVFGNRKGMRYYVVLMRFASLNLTADGIHMLNNAKQKLYKAYIRFLTDCLPADRRLAMGFVIGRKASWTKRNVKYYREGWSQSRGQVSLDGRDSSYAETLADCMSWLTRLESEGSKWRPEAPLRAAAADLESTTTTKSMPKTRGSRATKRKHSEHVDGGDGGEGENEASTAEMSQFDRPIELCPNMKNKNDHPWHGYKKRLAARTDEITQVLNIGPGKRNAMIKEGVRGWQDIRKKHLEQFRIASIDAVDNILRANRTGRISGLEAVARDLPTEAPVEFYFDFETVSDLNEKVGQELFDTSPGIGGQSNIIYMIGCYVRDTRTGEHEYLNYLVDEIDPANERRILTEWINDLHEIMEKHYGDGASGGMNTGTLSSSPSSLSEQDEVPDQDSGSENGDSGSDAVRRTRSGRIYSGMTVAVTDKAVGPTGPIGSTRKRKRAGTDSGGKPQKRARKSPMVGSRPKIRLFHWSPAEITQLRRAERAYGSMITDLLAESEFIDLYALFKKNEVGIPGAFGYGLKSVAKALHGLGKIESTWEENMNGADAMVAAWYLKYRTDHQHHTYHNAHQEGGTLLEPEKINEKMYGKTDESTQKPADTLAEEIILYNYYDCKVMDEITELVRGSTPRARP